MITEKELQDIGDKIARAARDLDYYRIEIMIEDLNVVDKDSLVIIDELGSGTSPLDGEALGLGVIDYLLKINCFSLISSHYEAIKNYSLENDDILCASMVFDEKSTVNLIEDHLYVTSHHLFLLISRFFL